MVDCAPTMQIDTSALADCFPDEHPAMKRALSSPEQRALKKLRYSSSDSAFSIISDEAPAGPLFGFDNHDCEPSPVTQSPHSPALKHGNNGKDEKEPPAAATVADEDEGDNEEDIGTFADSFATGDAGAQGWTEKTLVQVLTNDIEDLCMANESSVDVPEVADDLKIFFSQYKQPFDMDFYVQRLVQYSNCSASAFVAALVYLDRVHVRCRSLSMSEMNCHRLLSTALVLAIKYLDDEVYANAYYARVSGLTLQELNVLEAKMLQILDWRLSISPQEYLRYEDSLHKSAAILESEPLSPTSGDAASSV